MMQEAWVETGCAGAPVVVPAGGIAAWLAASVLGAALCRWAGLDAGRSVMLWLASGAVAAWPFIEELRDEPFAWWSLRWIGTGGVVTWILHSI